MRSGLPVKDLLELEGRKLACHCRLNQRCHGDVLIDLFSKLRESKIQDHSLPAPSDERARAEADRRRADGAGGTVSQATLDRQRPTLICGFGDPLWIGRGSARRLLADGGGLCSPGMWPPEKRHKPRGLALKLRGALQFELAALDKSFPRGSGQTARGLGFGQGGERPLPRGRHLPVEGLLQCAYSGSQVGSTARG